MSYNARLLTITLLMQCAVCGTISAVETSLIVEPTGAHPRNSEGDILPLQDGSLCLVYTQFYGGTSDHADAHLVKRISADGGKTWGKDQTVVQKEGGKNVMSVSLLRLQDESIALFYLRKISLQDCRPIMRVSRDEGKTWSDPVECITDQVGYYVLNNDRAVQLASGRIVLPVAMHATREQPEWDGAGQVMCYLSDDRGKTWRRSRDVRKGKRPTGERETLQEPGVAQLKDGRLMMFCRTGGGSQYVGYSSDNGETWSELQPSTLVSPLSPATIERIPWSGDLVCVWNDHSGEHPFPAGKRTPLCLATSSDGGKTWSKSRLIEGNADGWYCYTSMTFVEDGLFLSYCAGDRWVGGLNRLKVLSITRADLEQGDDFQEPPPPALLKTALDYGRSFIHTKASWNSPRFWVESRCRITDGATGKTVDYYQCGSCKSEITFPLRGLFQHNNYDFLPIFSAEQAIVFRHRLRESAQYREVRKAEAWWDGNEPRLREVKARILRTPREIFEAMDAGVPLVGQTELRNEKTGSTAVLEYPIKTINWRRDDSSWQVDTGPVLLPDLGVPPDQWSHTFHLAYVAFNAWDWAEFVVKKQTAIPDGQDKTWHYSETVAFPARNVLLALDED